MIEWAYSFHRYLIWYINISKPNLINNNGNNDWIKYVNVGIILKETKMNSCIDMCNIFMTVLIDVIAYV